MQNCIQTKYSQQKHDVMVNKGLSPSSRHTDACQAGIRRENSAPKVTIHHLVALIGLSEKAGSRQNFFRPLPVAAVVTPAVDNQTDAPWSTQHIQRHVCTASHPCTPYGTYCTQLPDPADFQRLCSAASGGLISFSIAAARAQLSWPIPSQRSRWTEHSISSGVLMVED